MDKRVPNAAIRRVWLDEALTSAEAAAAVGLSRVRLWVRAKALGLPARKDGRRPVIPDGELVLLWQGGVRVAEIAALYRCPKTSVRGASRRIGLPPRPTGRHIVVSLTQFRTHLLRLSMRAPLTMAERAILDRMRAQGVAP